MLLSDLGKLIVDVGVLPAIIAALMYLVYRLLTDFRSSIVAHSCAVTELSKSLDKLTEYVRGRQDA
jgi:hypothetical protein